MLQPVEIQEVSGRFAREIAALRKFLAQAAIPLNSDISVREVADRLARDRAFHRDLSSHLWVLLDESETPLRSADLLGIVTIAAAGPHEAAAIEEHDAHALLRFLMETKHSFEGKPLRSTEGRPHTPAAGAVSVEERSKSTSAAVRPEMSRAPLSSGERRTMPVRADGTTRLGTPVASSLELRSDETRKKRALLVLIAGSVVAIVALLAVWYWSRPSEPGRVQVASSSDVRKPASDTGSLREPQPSQPTDMGRFTPPARDRSRPVETPRAAPLAPSFPRSLARNDAPLAVPAPASAQPTVGSAASSPVPPTVAPASGASISSAGVLPARPSGLRQATRPSAAAAPVPADLLTRQLDSPRLPAYASEIDETGKRKYPRLLRRHATDADSGGGSPDPVLTAELRAPDLAAAGGRTSPVAAPRGQVRATCVGMMAGNLIYSPSPQYPAGAASAHVQGEVKIQATVDRDGSINSARVISGPPPLRDAALDAVQQWRFKPFVSGGKATPSAAMAVVEFELQ